MQGYRLLFKSLVLHLAQVSPVITALLLAAVVILAIRFPILDDILSLPYRVFIWVATHLGLTRKKVNWSVVYDSKTKLPLDPAYVTVRNAQGLEVSSMITDLNGRFTLILPRGIYTIDVQKTNYAFPSYEMRNATTDGQYNNLYYGKNIQVLKNEEQINIAIPMDQVGDDWNQQEKKRLNIVSNFSKEEYIEVSEYIYLVVGLLLSGIHYFWYFDTMSGFVACCYMVVILIIALHWVFQSDQHTASAIIEKHSGNPIPFARISIFKEGSKNQLLRKITSYEGQFTALIPKGRYYMNIETRDAAGVYSLAHTTAVFSTRGGSLSKKFFV